jgi:hypothetical protein
MVRLSLDELASQSDAIVVATAGDSQARWDNGHIVTDVSVHIDRTLAGTPEGASIVVRLPGGVVDGTGQRVEGAPVLERGAQRVLFLRREAAGRYHVAGMSQGVLPVTSDASGVTRIGPADASSVSLVEPPVNHSRVTMPRGGMSLATFAQTVGAMRLRAP